MLRRSVGSVGAATAGAAGCELPFAEKSAAEQQAVDFDSVHRLMRHVS